MATADQSIQLQTFSNLLSSHDWFYDFSDDRHTYTRGRDSWSAISLMAKNLKSQGLELQVDKLLLDASPHARK